MGRVVGIVYFFYIGEVRVLFFFMLGLRRGVFRGILESLIRGFWNVDSIRFILNMLWVKIRGEIFWLVLLVWLYCR